MVASVSDEGPAGPSLRGYFAVASARRVVSANPEFDFTFVNGGGPAGDIDLVAMPSARISTVTRPLEFHFVAPILSDVSPGIYGDGSLAPEEVVKGYRIYLSVGVVSSLRTSAGWSAIFGVLPLGQNAVIPIGVPCPPSGGWSFGYALVFDGYFARWPPAC